jgi:hypothetical protein
MSSEGLSALEKNAVICPQWAILPSQSVVTAGCRLKWPFGALFLKFELVGRLWQPAANYNSWLCRSLKAVKTL